MKFNKILLLFILAIICRPSVCQSQVNAKIDSIQQSLQTAPDDTNKVKTLVKLSYMSANNPDDGVKYGLQAYQLAQKLDFKRGQAGGLTAAGNAENALSDYPKAFEYLKNALAIYTQIGNKAGEAACLSNLGNVYIQTSDLKNALDNYQKALKINIQIGNITNEATNLIGIGSIYLYQTNYLLAIQTFEDALKIHTQLNNKVGQAIDIGNIGTIYFNQANYTKALDYFLRAIKLNREMDNRPGEALMLGNIGNIQQKLKNDNQALDYQQQALNMYRSLGNKAGEALTLSNIGSIYFDLKNKTKSLDFFQKALKLNKEIGNKEAQVNILNNIAMLNLHNKGDSTKSMDLVRQSEKIESQIGNKSNVARLLLTKADVYLQSGNFSQALENIQKALEVSRQTKSLFEQKDAYYSLYEIYEKMNQSARALVAYKQYITLNDSVINVDKQKEATRMEMRFAYETKEAVQKEKQAKKDAVNSQELKDSRAQRNIFILAGLIISLIAGSLFFTLRKLNKLNRLVMLEKEKSEQLGKVKDKLFSIISHDLRSPLTTLHAITKLIGREDVSIEEFKSYMANFNASLNSSINLLDNLLEWSISQIESSPPQKEAVDLYELAEENLQLFKSIAELKNINIQSDVEKGSIVLADKNILRLVMRNLINNAIKFSAGGEVVKVTARKHNNEMLIAIKDTGIGMNEKLMQNLFLINRDSSRRGTNKEPGSGLGLALSKELIEKNGGRIYAESQEGEGSTFYVSMPALLSD